MKLNPNEQIRREIENAIAENDGYCPCRVDRNEDTICPCKDFRDSGDCCCGLYVED